jgi:hypothetical protein
MSVQTIYAGPGKLYTGGVAIWPETENGELKYEVDQEKLAVSSAMHGHLRHTQGDATGKISIKPLDNWGILGVVYLPCFGASVGAAAGLLAIGTRLHGDPAAPAASKLWTPDGRMITVVRTGVSKPPEMHLGAGVALFSVMELSAIGDASKKVGDAAFLHTIAESGAADPGGVMAMGDFIRESWTGAWGANAGFTAMEAEEDWVVVPEIKWQFYKSQKVTRLAKLISAAWMIKARLVGPTQTQIDAAIGINNGRLLGSSFGSTPPASAGSDLVLTSLSGKTVTLKKADAVGEGFEFGGSKLGVGEVGFVNQVTFTAGAPDPLIVFSA